MAFLIVCYFWHLSVGTSNVIQLIIHVYLLAYFFYSP